ncbi:hypothetical protein CYMTET_25291 [Cymbomonas tetramitiformis]|uniref:SMODS and SLOG-associating 2TM effector domain-containing protein n=1 Tax=Cymbomonas tetramitiformis TaxID=36881 RepID=A0AAE0FVM6_9CHLO|nr:hypothetical protein CYMTET_25291 [Cymbomonas tetramitiformis]
MATEDSVVTECELSKFKSIDNHEEITHEQLEKCQLDELLKHAAQLQTAKDALQELEKLQIQATFSLIEDIKVKDHKSKILFLTNKQAHSLDLSNLERFIQAMNIEPRPKFVINFLSSMWISPCGSREDNSWSDFARQQGSKDYSGCEPVVAELGGLAGNDRINERLLRFLRECVLPVAIQTNALVLTTDIRCLLGKHFGWLCEKEAEVRGGNLPFTTICVNSAVDLTRATKAQNTLASTLYTQSTRWKEGMRDIQQAMAKTYGPWESKWLPKDFDVPSGCTHYITVDSVNKEEQMCDWGPLFQLRARILQQFSKDLPSIAIVTGHHFWGKQAIEHISKDYIGRNLPLLCINSFVWPGNEKPRTVERTRQLLVQLQRQLVEEGGTNFLWMSIAAALHSAMKYELKQGRQESSEHKLIWQVLEQRVTDRHAQAVQFDKGDDAESDDVDAGSDIEQGNAPLGTTLRSGDDANGIDGVGGYASVGKGKDPRGGVDAVCGAVPVRQAPREKEEKKAEVITAAVEALRDINEEIGYSWYTRAWPTREEASLSKLEAEVNACVSTEDLDAVVREASLRWVGINGLHRRIKLLYTEHKDCFVPRKDGNWAIVLGVRPGTDLPAAKEALEMNIAKWREVCDSMRSIAKPDALYARFRRDVSALPDWWNYGKFEPLFFPTLCDSFSELLASSYTYSCPLDDFQGIRHIIGLIARIDRLPQENSEQAMLVLTRTWDKIDIYMHVATRSKHITNTFFTAMLLVSLAITVGTIISLNRPDVFANTELHWLVIVCTLLLTALTTFFGLMNPATKWQQLRSAALTLESEIWRFRTRSGPYSLNCANVIGEGTLSREPELHLLHATQEMSRLVLKSASVVDTAFLSRFNALFEEPKENLNVYKHGQHKGCPTISSGSRQGKEARREGLAVNTGGKLQQRGSKSAVGQGYLTSKDSAGGAPPARAGWAWAWGRGMEEEEDSAEAVVLAAGQDDHHSPIAPKQYIDLRVKPQLCFYQSRLPGYARARYSIEAAILGTSLIATLLAFMNMSQWAPISAATATALTAYSKFKGHDKKLQRMSEAIAGVETLLLWWGTLTEVEQANLSNVNALITACEETFKSERQAWVSTAMQSVLQMTAQVTKGDRNDGKLAGGKVD